MNVLLRAIDRLVSRRRHPVGALERPVAAPCGNVLRGEAPPCMFCSEFDEFDALLPDSPCQHCAIYRRRSVQNSGN